MRTLIVLTLGLLASLPLRAEEALGRVRAIYFQAAPGVLVDAKLARNPSAARWLDVELESGRRELVQLPRAMQARVGDVVAMRLGAPKSVAFASTEPFVASRVLEVRPATRLAAPER